MSLTEHANTPFQKARAQAPLFCKCYDWWRVLSLTCDCGQTVWALGAAYPQAGVLMATDGDAEPPGSDPVVIDL